MSVQTVTSIGKPAGPPGARRLVPHGALTLISLTGTGGASEATRVRDRAFRKIVDEQAGTAVARWFRIPLTCESTTHVQIDLAVARQREKNQAAIRLLDSWMHDDSRHDEENWPAAKKAIEENRMSYRKRFRD